jgi:hypothetical protein
MMAAVRSAIQNVKKPLKEEIGLSPHDQPSGHLVRFCPHFARK